MLDHAPREKILFPVRAEEVTAVNDLIHASSRVRASAVSQVTLRAPDAVGQEEIQKPGERPSARFLPDPSRDQV